MKNDDGDIVSEDQVSVTLSPQQFKALSIVCSNSIRGYEENFGELHLPPTFTPNTGVSDAIREALEGAKASNGRKRPSKRSRASAQE